MIKQLILYIFGIAEAHFLFMYFLSVGGFVHILTFSAAEITETLFEGKTIEEETQFVVLWVLKSDLISKPVIP